mmetsp:Transcript_64051/g.171375  ORF Transcript_64051/g.171375 Transcript_64051/m.171375 type:complete len:296 (+) Transcript_64051:122-1009(+)
MRLKLLGGRRRHCQLFQGRHHGVLPGGVFGFAGLPPRSCSDCASVWLAAAATGPLDTPTCWLASAAAARGDSGRPSGESLVAWPAASRGSRGPSVSAGGRSRAEPRSLLAALALEVRAAGLPIVPMSLSRAVTALCTTASMAAPSLAAALLAMSALGRRDDVAPAAACAGANAWARWALAASWCTRRACLGLGGLGGRGGSQEAMSARHSHWGNVRSSFRSAQSSQKGRWGHCSTFWKMDGTATTAAWLAPGRPHRRHGPAGAASAIAGTTCALQGRCLRAPWGAPPPATNTLKA